MNTITFFITTLALATGFVIASGNNGDVDVNGTTPTAVSGKSNTVPPPAPPTEDITVSGQE